MRVTSAAVESSVLEALRASGDAALTGLSEDKADFCPHCRSLLEIINVRFRFNGTAMIATCPHCANACVDEWRAAESKTHDKRLVITPRSLWHGVAMMDLLDRRFKYLLAFLIGALITAAALRHGLHVYGGISREEMRWDALMAITVVALAILFVRRKRQGK
jgi:hypothetical protein